MTLLLWIVIFGVSLAVLIKGADLFTESAEKIGLALKISPFIIGVTIVAIGTSLPELTTGIIAVLKQNSEINVATLVGSNIANILLIIGLACVLGGMLILKRSLIDLDLPLLASITALFIFCASDKKITSAEALILILAYFIYLTYTIVQRREKEEEEKGLVRFLRRAYTFILGKKEEVRKAEVIEVFPPEEKEKLRPLVFFSLVLGGAMLYFGANFTVDSLIKIASMLGVSASLIAILALAIGTSLPELAVTIRTAFQKKYEISIGNIIGSNIFRLSAAMGITGIVGTLHFNESTFRLGIPFLGAVTLLFIISGISKRFHVWDGAIYLVIYVLFIGMLFGLF